MLSTAGLMGFLSLGGTALLPDDFHDGRTSAGMWGFNQLLWCRCDDRTLSGSLLGLIPTVVLRRESAADSLQVG